MMTKYEIRELERLVSEFANANFDCGAWQDDDDTGADAIEYKELQRIANEARDALIEYVINLH